LENGIQKTISFFHSLFKKNFNVFVHPDRQSLDSTWSKDWQMPEFKSECWMVASGVANRLDIISPKSWESQSCEHNYSDKTRTQQLVTHEIVHVFHGQINKSPDFNDANGIEWFVEGLATFASGQCNNERIAEIKTAIKENKIPGNLGEFWTGKIRYGLSGSVVMYIDHQYGRNKLKELLPLNKNSEILSLLHTSEPELIAAWSSYIQDL
jgi:hypothetical protein